MSVYTVYTKTLHVPTYVLYQCQSCKKTVVDKGSFDISASYSDEGTWTRKGVMKRELRANDRLLSEATKALSELQDTVVIIERDFRRINCQCPYCYHASLSKYDNDTIKQIKKRLALIIFASIMLIIFILSTIMDSASTIIAMLVMIGILSVFGSSIFGLYDNYQIRNAYKENNPMISANKKLLIEKANASPIYRDVDFSIIQDMPDILDLNC